HGRAAMPRDADLVLEVVIVCWVVGHDRKDWDASVRRGPERARVVHEVAVRLDVHDELVRAAIRESDAKRDGDLRRRAEGPAGMTRWRVHVPQAQRPV